MKKIIAIIMAIFMLIPVYAEEADEQEEKEGYGNWQRNVNGYRTDYVYDSAKDILKEPARGFTGFRSFGPAYLRSTYSADNNVDYACFGSDACNICAKAYSGCENLRTVMICSPNTTLSCSSYDTSNGFNCKTDMEKLPEYVNETKEETFERLYHNCVFVDSPKLTIIGYGGTQAEAYAESHGIPFIPAFIRNGEPSTVVAQAVQNATVTINGVDIPAYTVNGSVYVGETVLKNMGVYMGWDSMKRYVEIASSLYEIPKVSDFTWSVTLDTNPNPYSIDVYSSDIVFWYEDMRIPALNVGNGESIIDVNVLAEKVLY